MRRHRRRRSVAMASAVAILLASPILATTVLSQGGPQDAGNPARSGQTLPGQTLPGQTGRVPSELTPGSVSREQTPERQQAQERELERARERSDRQRASDDRRQRNLIDQVQDRSQQRRNLDSGLGIRSGGQPRRPNDRP